MTPDVVGEPVPVPVPVPVPAAGPVDELVVPLVEGRVVPGCTVAVEAVSPVTLPPTIEPIGVDGWVVVDPVAVDPVPGVTVTLEVVMMPEALAGSETSVVVVPAFGTLVCV